MPLGEQVAFLFLLALPTACVAWTVTHEEVFREPRDYCKGRSERAPRFYTRKFFYLFTCEYCFSHYVAGFFLGIAHYKLLFMDWRGYVIGFFALVWISNVYMNIYSRIRLDIKKERTEIALEEKAAEAVGGDQPLSTQIATESGGSSMEPESSR
ncbi:MAG: hypothetical protein ACRD34_12930 [Bryobacteraceae bacterium]